ncbi:MAG: 2TM domain-containing protein [Microcella sp.]|uniref:2TM domain-containing protein n=1 Tax=Microcella sp. TaxID=1913979 RepID=UPI0033152DBB
MSTNDTTTESERVRKQAYRRLKAQRDFFRFLLVWAAVSAIVSGVWAFLTPTAFFWPIFVIGGMGIAAMFMAIDAFGPGSVITEADIDAEVQRMSRRRGA